MTPARQDGEATVARGSATDGAAAGRLVGRSIVAGRWAETSSEAFQPVDPASGRVIDAAFHAASDVDVDGACWQAWEAFYAGVDAEARAEVLEGAAEGIVGLGDALITTASRETGLGVARLVAERERTTSTLRMFAALVRRGDWVEATIDTAEPSRRPMPKPDVRSMLRAVGPVAVFGASNFPLAYSVAGGDTASALAAGCPVIVKGHPSHPGTSELVGRAVAEAIERAGVHPGFFSMLQTGGERAIAIGEALVTHPCVRAVGFTGSVAAGRSLAWMASGRADPIPVFAEMGSTNPVFVLDGAMEAHGELVARRLAESVRNANGQMCTSPGLVFAMRGVPAESLVKALATIFNESAPETMLSPVVRDRFIERTAAVGAIEGVEVRGGSPMGGHREAASGITGDPIRCSPVVYRAPFEAFRRHATLRDEVFGPAVVVVVCDGEDELLEAAATIQGSLTGTIWAAGRDGGLAQRVQRVLEQRVGRLIFNGVPTGVEVCEAMVHGGPYPASSDAHFTSVGVRSIRRWVRPVCYQNGPDAFLPAELRNSNPLGIVRRVDGEATDGPVGTRR